MGRGWRILVWLLCGLLSIPALVILGSLAQGISPAWQHLAETVLSAYLLNSLWLVLGVGAGTLLIGVSCAWLVAVCDFPGRRFFAWALLLPMAIPAYILAYTYTGMLDFSGPVQTLLRETFDWQYGDYWFPPIRSLGGAIAMLSLVLYPYVFLMARVAFTEQAGTAMEAARSLGKTPRQVFFGVSLPMARPAIVAGLSLALMETLADYGTVDYFGVSAFTTGIFRTWYGLGELTTAAQLSALLLLFVLILLTLERGSRRHLRHSTDRARPFSRLRLRGGRRWTASGFCSLVLLAGFLLPAAQLLQWVLMHIDDLGPEFQALALSSFLLACGASLLCLVVAVIFGFALRLRSGRLTRGAIRVASMGYAIPGTVIAVGVLVALGWSDRQLDSLARATLGNGTGLLLSGTFIALLFAYLVRFLPVSLNGIEAGLSRIRPSMEEAARSLGDTPGRTLRRVHLPLLRGSLLVALLLVFVDVLKELPATLILRPFNVNTLAVRTYELASDERLTEAALPALTIVAIGLIPVLFIMRQLGSERS